MINVTDGYKTAVYSPSRTVKGKVAFEIVDTTAAGDATATVTGEASIGKKALLFDSNRQMTGKYATFENDYWALDGSFVLPPKSSESGYEVGWWSDELCGADGVFANAQVITAQFTQDHSSIGLTITFDELTNEYAEEFEIVVYDSSNNVLHTETVIGNTLVKYELEENLSNYRKVVVTITKWANGYRRARITEIDFGIIEEYTGVELINMNVLEEVDTLSNTVSSNEMKFTVDNQDKRFNILNPTGIYPYLQRKQRLIPYLGVERADAVVEYVPMGIFYLIEWKSDEGTLTASFTGRDILDMLSQDEFAGNTYTSETLYDISIEVLTAAGITDYSIDTALQSITVSGSIDKVSYREALQLIAMAGMAVIYSDRSGVLTIKQLPSVALDETIDFDNVYSPPLIKLDTLINTVYVDLGGSTYTYVDPEKPAGEQTLSVQISNSLITNAGIAANVAAWVLAEYKKRFLYEINWRQNPALECCDIVTSEDEFGENKTIRITRQEFNFQGALSGKTYGKGGGS